MTTQQVLDKQGLQHYATKMCNAENRKVGSKSLPTALNDIDIAIDGFKTLFDNEYGAPVAATIENNSNIFTVGTGNGIDKSKEVQNSLTDIELSGNSMVNCIIPNTFTSSNNMGEKENNPVYNNGTIKMTSFGSINQTRFSPKFERGIIKPNTDYTFVFNVSQNSLSGQTFLTYVDYTDASAHNVSPFSVNNAIQGRKTGVFKYCIRSKSDLSDCDRLFRTLIWNDSKEGETITFSVMILEGNWTNKSLPEYFEGLKSVGEKENCDKINILSCGKNLYPYNASGNFPNSNGSWYFGNGVGGAYSDMTNKEKQLHFTLEAGTYYFSCKTKNTTQLITLKEELSFNKNSRFTIDKKTTFIIRFLKDSNNNVIFEDIQITKDMTPTEYEPYKSNQKEILLNEPLRGLPGGAKDTIEKVNGKWKLIRRCREMILNGKENWGATGGGGHATKNTFEINLPYNGPRQGSISCLSDLFANNVTSGIPDENCFRCVYDGIVNKGIFLLFSPRTSLIPYRDTNAWKKWLSQNPVKVIYELETPIIEDIDPVVLQCWKGGNIFIDEVLPVESTHTVALNKPAQIQNNIEELTSLRDRVQKLEEQYNSTILTQAYQTILLNFDNDL